MLGSDRGPKVLCPAFRATTLVLCRSKCTKSPWRGLHPYLHPSHIRNTVSKRFRRRLAGGTAAERCRRPWSAAEGRGGRWWKFARGRAQREMWRDVRPT
eukprot:1467394-Prymnesium_polylepis.1